jgi:CO dehydrogenase maturation factor
MGLFHCPIGAAVYEDSVCIRCGLCMAKTREEAVVASKIIREYLKTHVSARAKKYLIQKIAVCGKGGVGKSTVSTLITRCLEEYGYNLLVIDTDESNPGLFRSFGFEMMPRPLMSSLERFSLGEQVRDTQWLEKDAITFDDVPSEFILGNGNLRFMMVGKIDDPFQGCACSMADVTRDFIIRLTPKDREIALVDSEAGVESFGRGVERGVDTLLIVVEPSYESLALSEKISYMAEGIGIPRIRAILNKIPSVHVEEKIIKDLIRKGIRYLGAVYLDSKVSEAGFEGMPLSESEAKGQMRTITRLMLDEAEMKYRK